MTLPAAVATSVVVGGARPAWVEAEASGEEVG